MFNILLLKENIREKKLVDRNITKLNLKDNNKEYKVEVI